ncbi:16S rRNA (guanine(527)-N(7))-methyltransferase RsmG [Campylobacter sputorum]|uniref:16S rRNA (guanine(527)-N(7))-methyltransferase RsmG n=1 Tax=Campylobacter sputorum TaxID=206 RepID=UPI00053BF225|nr:16S rRNA (guanine(527)-N(7))-methyltransferase RsmG [Campylobacter sputorum]
MIDIPDNFYEKCDKFKELLYKFNTIHSFTTYKNIDDVIEDSIKPLEFLNFYPKNAIDIGSGAGFPAIFLALILKDCKWSLYEPHTKKSSFLNYVKVALNLENIIVYNAKIESCKKFIADFITSRAVMKTKDLLQICNGFYDENTKFLFYKGSSVEDEIQDLNTKIFNDGVRNYLFMEKLC